MQTHSRFLKVLTAVTCLLIVSTHAYAQSKAYSRKKAPVKAVTNTGTNNASAIPVGAEVKSDALPAVGSTKAATPGRESEKLDIQDLEQKYWAPKDTDFSVVQNRTYTKTKKLAVSLMAGPLVNDPFNEGNTYALNLNYYPDERYGFELMYQKNDLTDSSTSRKFVAFSGGATRPDFNRDLSFYGVGFNYVPFYAKMSFLGKKIFYFDMQVTPFLGMSEYKNIIESSDKTGSAFSYGFDLTQYFFFSSSLAVRANLHNRFYQADVYGYRSGKVARPKESMNTTIFLMGITYFF